MSQPQPSASADCYARCSARLNAGSVSPSCFDTGHARLHRTQPHAVTCRLHRSRRVASFVVFYVEWSPLNPFQARRASGIFYHKICLKISPTPFITDRASRIFVASTRNNFLFPWLLAPSSRRSLRTQFADNPKGSFLQILSNFVEFGKISNVLSFSKFPMLLNPFFRKHHFYICI